VIEIFDMLQGSPEWFQVRLGLPTASEFGAILAKGQGKVRRGYLCRLAAERLLGETQETYTNHHFRRGKEMESEARDLYAFINEVDPTLVGFIRNEIAGCSPDALIGEDGMLEIKTRLPALMVDVLAQGGTPPEHKAQLQGGLWITERSWCDFVAYWPGMPLYVARVERDDEYIEGLAQEVTKFADELAALVQRISQGSPSSILRDQLERSLAAC
jgi:hypothetical protein